MAMCRARAPRPARVYENAHHAIIPFQTNLFSNTFGTISRRALDGHFLLQPRGATLSAHLQLRPVAINCVVGLFRRQGDRELGPLPRGKLQLLRCLPGQPVHHVSMGHNCLCAPTNDHVLLVRRRQPVRAPAAAAAAGTPASPVPSRASTSVHGRRALGCA